MLTPTRRTEAVSPSGTRRVEQDAAGLSAEFVFSSPHRSLLARGCLARIESPVHERAREDDARQSAFLKTVQAALDLARKKGQRHPVVLGAIPFDTRQPSALVVPQEVEFIDREALMARARVSPLQARVAAARSIPDQQCFKQGVRQAIANFQHSCIRKAVLSRLCEIELEQPVDIEGLLANLMVQNPAAYHFRLPMGDGSALLGASPELLLRLQGRQVETFPLAGTAARQASAADDEAVAQRLLASGKDLHEHRLVVEDIQQRLRPLCDALEVPPGPALVSTPHLWHLGTPIAGQLKAGATAPLAALDLACLLHPTPAVCGFPRLQASKLVHLIEPFERGPFTGIVGWCDAEGQGEWVVTIRCATVLARRLRLFAGVGVVEASCPDAEWAETQAKLGTMLRAIGLGPEVLA